jgi:hypothetical protein
MPIAGNFKNYSLIDEESENPTIEKQIEIQYWFPSNGDPNSSNSVFHSQQEFIDSLLKNQEPTLIFNSRNYQLGYKLTLPLIFPLHFPFGQGGIEEERQTHISTEECLKHYLNISLPMFQHSDIILVISHMYFRKKLSISILKMYVKVKPLWTIYRGTIASNFRVRNLRNFKAHKVRLNCSKSEKCK